MAKASYGFADCTTLHCPRTDAQDFRPLILKSQLTQDVTGHYWCGLCSRRCELMNWGHENHWPSVRVQGKMRYAIYGEKDEWFISIMAASEDMISALHETLILHTREPLPPVEM